MRLLNKISGWFFLFVVLSVSPQILAQTSDHKNQAAVPELPPEEVAQAVAPQEKEAEKAVINYDETKTAFAFFSDNSFTKGASRYLNVIDIGGYMRTRFAFFHNAHLGTYIPGHGGISNFPPNASFLVRKDNVEEDSKRNASQNAFSGNMRLRLDPTINISEVARVRTTIDVFDNMVLGTIPGSLALGVPSLNASHSQVNAIESSIALKRAWAEVSFPIGELRFGRMPMHWGLGILYNSGDGINSDHGDAVDGIFFSTRVFDHFLTPGYSVSYTGPSHRGAGLFAHSQDFQSAYMRHESGQRYPIESSDMAHVLSLSFAKRDSEFMINKRREEGLAIYNYGIFTSYRRQYLDSQAHTVTSTNNKEFLNRLVRRNSNIGTASLWQSLSFGAFHIELEAAGIWGKHTIGETAHDEMAKNNKPKRDANGKIVRDANGNIEFDQSPITQRDVWFLQGGVALQSRYGFLNDRLQVGLDAGFASYQDGPGFGLRENGSGSGENGDLDGRKGPNANGYKTNFRFNPAYTVDLLLYKEVLAGIGSTFYLKPHIGYFFSRNFGLRGDVISSFAPAKSNTPGFSNLLGVELDASAFLRTDTGFYFQLSYGVLFPLKGLDRRKTPDISANDFSVFGEAKIAQTAQAYVGLVF